MTNDARLNDELSTQKRARILGFDYIDTSQIQPKVLYQEILPTNVIRQFRVIPVKSDKNSILFGITNTTSKATIDQLRQSFSDKVTSFYLISDSGFREYLNLYDPPKEVIYKDIHINNAGSENLINEVSGILNEVKSEDMLAYIVSQAHKLNASDIHIETQTNFVRIRFRIDGVLHIIARLSFDKYRVLMAAIASAGNISTNDPDAQQGHIAQRVEMQDKTVVDVNLRLETVPTINGMDAVMRLFNLDQSRFTINNLGLSDSEKKVIEAIISKPSGLVMTVGPTGSGKTTTLYSILNDLNTDNRKIITIEDPVEYKFHGITQISIERNDDSDQINFASKLRAVLRLDPDIVMVGEIRDNDTATTALQASLTGHLVLTTFHATNAAAALTRLADIISQNPLFVSPIRLIMAQRLVRKLDESSKISYTPSPEELKTLTNIINTFPANIPRPDITNLQLYKPGSSKDNPYGFSGQLALREQLFITPQIREILVNPSRVVSTQEVEQAAVEGGMKTMLHDAALKIIAGQTTFSEIYRVLS